MPTRLSVDFEHPSRTWWESGGQELWDGLAGEPGANRIFVEDSIAASWLAQAERIPGWSDGPGFAPHPVTSQPVADDEEAEY